MKRARPKPAPSLPPCLTFVAPLPLASPTHVSRAALATRTLRRVAPLVPNRAARLPAASKPPISATASTPSRANLTTVSERFLKAVEKLSRQPRQTVSDIAATAGIPLADAADEAVLLASLVAAPIDVTDAGDLAYRFPPNVRSVLRARSALAALAMTWRRAAPALFLFARVAFGALLVVSIVVTFVAIAALSSASRSSDDNRRSSSSSFFAPRLFGPDIFDVMYFTSRSRRARPDGEMSFFEAVYSFVFGDADPNAEFPERRWRTVAAVIRASRGAVTAEQLAPYLDPPQRSRDDASSSLVDESFMLPALTRFQGHPEVTEQGDIIYVFPDFVKTGRRSAAGRTEMAGTLSTAALIEEEVPLTRAPQGQRVLVTALGAVNILGVLVLGSKLLTVVPVTAEAAALVAGVQAIYAPLFAYATSFFLVPMVRWFQLKTKNEKIRERNQARQDAATSLRVMGPQLREKMLAAEQYVVKGGEVRDDDVVYSSDQDLIDQTRMQDDMTDDFDRRLGGR